MTKTRHNCWRKNACCLVFLVWSLHWKFWKKKKIIIQKKKKRGEDKSSLYVAEISKTCLMVCSIVWLVSLVRLCLLPKACCSWRWAPGQAWAALLQLAWTVCQSTSPKSKLPPRPAVTLFLHTSHSQTNSHACASTGHVEMSLEQEVKSPSSCEHSNIRLITVWLQITPLKE